LRSFDIPEVLEVHEIPSEEVRMVPSQPTVTNNPVVVVLSVLVVLDELLDEVQDMEMETKKKYGEDNEYMFHLVSYWWL